MEKLVERLPKRPQPLPVRYAAATILMAACVSLQLAIAHYSGLPGFFVLLTGIFLAGAVFDRGSGFYATLLAAISVYFTVEESYRQVSGMLAVPVFVAVGFALAAFGEALRLALERAIKAEREKDILVRELSHRMQNNLAMAVSLLDMQGRAHSNPEVKAALAKAVDRLNILAEGQRHLQTLGVGMVEMQAYLGQVCGHLSRSVGAARPIDFTFRTDPVSLPADTALVVGLITNELVINAIKYAFGDDRRGAITVAFSRGAEGSLSLTVADNGIGCPEDASDGFGSKLIKGLTAQHGGSYRRAAGSPGCRVEVTIPL